MQRIRYGFIDRNDLGGAPSQEKWDENLSIKEIINLKKEELKDIPSDLDEVVVNPCHYVKYWNEKYVKSCNAKPHSNERIENEADAHAIVRYLVDIEKINWKSCGIDCEFRASAAAEYLQGLQIDVASLFYAVVGNRSYSGQTDKKGPSFGLHQWEYHVALGINAKNGKRYILDPSVDPKKAMEIDEWREKIHAKDLSISYQPVKTGLDTSFVVGSTTVHFPHLKEALDKKDFPLLHEITCNYEND